MMRGGGSDGGQKFEEFDTNNIYGFIDPWVSIFTTTPAELEKVLELPVDQNEREDEAV